MNPENLSQQLREAELKFQQQIQQTIELVHKMAQKLHELQKILSKLKTKSAAIVRRSIVHLLTVTKKTLAKVEWIKIEYAKRCIFTSDSVPQALEKSMKRKRQAKLNALKKMKIKVKLTEPSNGDGGILIRKIRKDMDLLSGDVAKLQKDMLDYLDNQAKVVLSTDGMPA